MRYLLLLICICSVVSACRKKAVCKGNCTDIKISGRVYDAVNNSGLANQTIQVKWRRNGMCFFGCESDITTSRTDNNGNFNFLVTIDSSNLRNNYRLSVEVPTPISYLDDYGLHSINNMYTYSSSGLSNLQIGFLPKADLTVKLHRTLTDNFINFYTEVNYLNEHTRMSTGYSVYSPNLAKDSTLQREVVAGAYTYIIWRKTTAPGVYVEQKDSLICTKQGPNVFNIYY